MDSLGVILEALRTAVVVGLLVALPGAAIGPYLVPGASSQLARLARAAGIGLLATTCACTILAFVGLLRPTVLATVLAGLAVLPLHMEPPRPGRPGSRIRRWAGGFAFAGAAAAALVVAPWLVVAPGLVRDGAPLAIAFAPTDWSGVSAAVALADSGAFPVEVSGWGGALGIAGPQLPATAHLAAALQLLPGDLLDRLVVYRAVLAVAGVVVVAALFRRWLPTWPALAAGGLFVGLAGGQRPLFGDPTGAVSVVLAVYALTLADRALVERSGRLVGATALVGAAVLVQRPELFLAVAVATGGIAVSRWLVAPGGGPENAGGLGHRWGRRIGLRLSLRRAAVAPLLAGVAVLALGGAAGGVGAAALGAVARPGAVLGTVGEGPGAPPAGVAGVPPGWRATDDAWWDLERASLAVPEDRRRPPGTGDLESVAAAVFAGGSVGSAGMLPTAALLAIGTIAWPTLDQRRQRLVATLVALAIALGGTAIIVLASGESFADRRVVPDAVVPFGWLVVAGGVAYGGWLVAGRIGRRIRQALVIGRGRHLAGAVSAVVATAILALAVAGSAAAIVAAAPPPASVSPAALAAYRTVAERLPSGARLLVNARTDGIVAALGGRAGLIDGPNPDRSTPDLAERAAEVVLGARVVFLDPDGDDAVRFLLREGISHLLVAGDPAGPADIGARALLPTDLGALRSSERYALLDTVADGIYLFEVLPAS